MEKGDFVFEESELEMLDFVGNEFTLQLSDTLVYFNN